jgi:hypothetical protein
MRTGSGTTVTVFVATDVVADAPKGATPGSLGLLREGDDGGVTPPDAAESPSLTSEMERAARDRQRARQIASAWLRDVLADITPRGVTVGVIGPTECGPEVLGIDVTAANGRVVVTTVAFRDGRTRPRDPAPDWLSAGLTAARADGTRVLSVSRAGSLYGRM